MRNSHPAIANAVRDGHSLTRSGRGICWQLLWHGTLVLALAFWSHTADAQGDDSVLRALTRGTEALAAGNIHTAADAFDDATSSIGAIWGDSRAAQEARSLWYEESHKPFKGEPYERMMAFYYRGLLYFMDGDYGNAQAAFRQATMQDAFAEEEQHRADVVLPVYLQGWALRQQGSSGGAAEAFDWVDYLRPDLPLPEEVDSTTLLLIVETGFGPRKRQDGIDGEQLRFFRGRSFSEDSVNARIGNQVHALHMVENIYWQAATRGGRAVDSIIEGKVAFAQGTAEAGNLLTDLSEISAASSGSRWTTGRTDVTSRTIGALGVAALLFSSKARPAVDDRYWDNLPDAVHVVPLSLDPGEHTVTIEFFDEDGDLLPDLSRTVKVTVPQDELGIAWVSARDRSSSYLSGNR